MAGAFDDLIPSAAPAAGASAAAAPTGFDDLIPVTPVPNPIVQPWTRKVPASQEGVERFVRGVTGAGTSIGVPEQYANAYGRYLAGLLRGGKNVLDTGARLANNLIPLMSEEDVQKNLQARREFDQGAAGELGNFLGEQAAIAVPANRAAQGVNMLGTAAPRAMDAAMNWWRWAAYGAPSRLAQSANALAAPAIRALPAAVQPGAPTLLGGAAGAVPWLASKAIEGGAAGAVGNVLAGEGGENVGKDAVEGAKFGAIFNPALSTVLATPRIAGWALGQVGPAASREAARLAQQAERMGINLRGSQIGESEALKRADAMLGKMPLTGVAGQPADQAAAFSRAVSRTFGENTDTITPQVLNSARSRIGGEMNRIAQTTPVQYDNALHNRLAGIENDLLQVVSDSEARPLLNQLQNVIGKVNANNEIDGRAFAALIKKGSPLDNALSSPNANIRQYAGQIRNALDDAFERSAPQDVAEAWRAARSQYKAMMTVSKLADNIDGDISPAKLLAKVRQSYRDMPFTGTGNDLGPLAQIGQRFLKPPSSSGTAENQRAIKWLMGGVPLGAEAVLFLTNPALAMKAAAIGGGAAAGGALGARTAASALGSDAFRQAAIARALGQPMPAGPNAAFNNALTRGMTPFVVPNAREGVPAQ